MKSSEVIPTSRWLRSRNPETKEEVKSWYARELRVLEARRARAVFRPFEHTENGKIRVAQVECWKLSTSPNSRKGKGGKITKGSSDWAIYKAMLDKRREELMRKVK